MVWLDGKATGRCLVRRAWLVGEPPVESEPPGRLVRCTTGSLVTGLLFEWCIAADKVRRHGSAIHGGVDWLAAHGAEWGPVGRAGYGLAMQWIGLRG